MLLTNDRFNISQKYIFWVEEGIQKRQRRCSEIKRVASFKNILAFTDSGAYQVKAYDPVNRVVTVLVGSCQKGNEMKMGQLSSR